jgi:hypothetical protein
MEAHPPSSACLLYGEGEWSLRSPGAGAHNSRGPPAPTLGAPLPPPRRRPASSSTPGGSPARPPVLVGRAGGRASVAEVLMVRHGPEADCLLEEGPEGDAPEAGVQTEGLSGGGGAGGTGGGWALAAGAGAGAGEEGLAAAKIRCKGGCLVVSRGLGGGKVGRGEGSPSGPPAWPKQGFCRALLGRTCERLRLRAVAGTGSEQCSGGPGHGYGAPPSAPHQHQSCRSAQ